MADTKITTITHLEELANKSKSYTGELVADVASAVADVVAEVDAIKADKPEAVAFAINITDWFSSGITDFPYGIDIEITDLSADDIVTVTIKPASLSTAEECGLCPTCDTYDGGFTLYAAAVPSAEIAAEYYITKGTVSE